MKPGYYVSKGRCVLICAVWVTVTVVVGLMAGLINKSPCPDQESHQDDAAATEPPTTSGPWTDLASTLPPQGDGPWMDPFLPTFTQPLQYHMWFYPDFYFDGTTFQGRENISIEVLENTRYLIVHYKMMNITDTRVITESGQELSIVQTFAYDPHQYWVTEVAEEITAGSVVILQLEFEGSLVNGIVGYYKSTYINTDTGKERYCLKYCQTTGLLFSLIINIII